jgi:hypothetical protein
MIVRTKIGGKPHYWVSRYHAFHVLGLDNVRMHRTYAGAVPLERGGVYFLGY